MKINPMYASAGHASTLCSIMKVGGKMVVPVGSKALPIYAETTYFAETTPAFNNRYRTSLTIAKLSMLSSSELQAELNANWLNCSDYYMAIYTNGAETGLQIIPADIYTEISVVEFVDGHACYFGYCPNDYSIGCYIADDGSLASNTGHSGGSRHIYIVSSSISYDVHKGVDSLPGVSGLSEEDFLHYYRKKVIAQIWSDHADGEDARQWPFKQTMHLSGYALDYYEYE